MDKHKDFEKRVTKSLKHMEAKISFLKDGVKGLNEAFQEFQEEMGDYMTYSSEMYTEHENRISRLEKEMNI